MSSHQCVNSFCDCFQVHELEFGQLVVTNYELGACFNLEAHVLLKM